MATKKNLYRSVFAFLLVGVVSVNLSYGSGVRSLFHPKVARASLDIECDCAAFGTNNNCLASNYGTSCADAGTLHCQEFNGNCGGV